MDYGVNSRGDENTWDCTVCTFKNPAEAFKCLMCDVRKGTSTRKPRINPELVAQQVARQQQHLLLKISHGRAKDGNRDGNGKESRNYSDGNSRDGEDRRDSKVKDDGNESGPETKKTPIKQVKNRKSSNNDGNSPGPSSHNNNSNKNSSNSISKLKKSKKDPETKSPSVAALLASNNTDSSSSSSSTSSLSSSATTTTASSSKNGLASKLNIDRNNCSSEAVTVNNVTVIITEFLSDLKDGFPNDKSPSKSNHCLGTKQKKEAL